MSQGRAGTPIRWTFLAPALPRPAGGLFALFQHANAMARRGRAAVRLVHLPTAEGRLEDPSDIPWFVFDPSIEHVFPSQLAAESLPEADVLVYTVMAVRLCTAHEAGAGGRRLLEHLQAPVSTAGRPVLFVQALGVFPADVERLALSGAGLKVCVSSWIAASLVWSGVPATEVAYVPNGLDHRTFRVTRPIGSRPARVAMNFDPHPVKNMDAGIDALANLHRDTGVTSVLFGTRPPGRPLPRGLEFLDSPGQVQLAESVYNGATLYLQPGTLEGFGLCALEAMACGCALVTTSNGGSSEYALDGETAVLCGPEPSAMADTMTKLVADDERRVRIASAAAKSAMRFQWEVSAGKFERLATQYLAEPVR